MTFGKFGISTKFRIQTARTSDKNIKKISQTNNAKTEMCFFIKFFLFYNLVFKQIILRYDLKFADTMAVLTKKKKTIFAEFCFQNLQKLIF